MKVKKFRIKPRASSVGRILKGIMSVKQLPSEIELSIPKESEELIPHLIPAAFYQSWPQAETPKEFQSVLNNAGAHSGLMVSALIATVGSTAEEYLSQLLLNGETNRAQVVTAICEEAADLSFNFIYKLLVDDAKSDDCELSTPVSVLDPALLTAVLASLEASEEGITIDQASHLSPRFTRVALVAWWPMAKKKHATFSQKRRSA